MMSSLKITVPEPKIEDRKIKKPLLCGPGPCDLWPSIAEALTKPIVSPSCDEYYNIMDDIRAGLKYLFQTQSKLVLAISGSGHSGMETVISNLVGPKETLLIASRGIWDDRAFEIATRYGINAVPLRIPFNTTFTLEQIEVEMQKLRPTALFITHGDSSTGTVQNLKGLGNICHKYGALLLVDTVVSIGGVPFLMDEWGVDAVFASSQKALSGPVGIAPVAFNARAEYHHTMCPPMMWALRACLQEICNRTLPVCWELHKTTTAYFHKRLEGYNFKLVVPKVEDRLPTVTTVKLPKGYDYSEFCKYIRDSHNILIFPGLGPTVGKALRIGIMGVNCSKNVADAIVDAMVDALKALKQSSL